MLIHLLDVIYIFERRERGDYFAVRLVFFQLALLIVIDTEYTLSPELR